MSDEHIFSSVVVTQYKAVVSKGRRRFERKATLANVCWQLR